MKALHQLNSQRVHMPLVKIAYLVIAGGYDKRLAENREHYEEIRQLVIDLGLEQQVCCFLHLASTLGALLARLSRCSSYCMQELIGEFACISRDFCILDMRVNLVGYSKQPTGFSEWLNAEFANKRRHVVRCFCYPHSLMGKGQLCWQRALQWCTHLRTSTLALSP